ncbi:MAG: Fe-S cluster assembly scaffold protein NifU [Methanosarcinaceae archaeon]|nr:Fe-S cluster assembly scaffold protein NifU [Methanosarcinaceae archaeon]
MVEPIEYSEKVKDHFRNPRNVGIIKDADAIGQVGNPVCGDMMEIQLKVEDNIIKDIKFRTFGCASAIATSSMVTEMAKGMTLEKALEITRSDVADDLGGLPMVKMHCSNLAADALHAAIKDYMDKQKSGVKKLGDNEYEVAVVGSGAAGLSAATVSAYMGLKTVIFESGTWGGVLNKMCSARLIENYPGLTGKMSPAGLTKTLLEDAEKQHVDRKEKAVSSIDIEKEGDIKVLTTEDGTEYKARFVVLATGSMSVELGIPGEEKFAQNEGGVYYLSTDPSKLADKRVLIYGKGYNAISTAECLSGIVDSITLVTEESSFGVPDKVIDKVKKIESLKIMTSTNLLELQGAKKVEKAVLQDNTEDEKLEIYVDAVVLVSDLKPDIKAAEHLGVDIDESGFVKTDKHQRTNVDGVYAVGNVASDVDLLIVAAAHGAIVGHDVYNRLKAQ